MPACRAHATRKTVVHLTILTMLVCTFPSLASPFLLCFAKAVPSHPASCVRVLSMCVMETCLTRIELEPQGRREDLLLLLVKGDETDCSNRSG
jgi:hypothetical protein